VDDLAKPTAGNVQVNESQKMFIRDKIFAKLHRMHPIDKLTSMLMNSDDLELKRMMASDDYLKSKVQQQCITYRVQAPNEFFPLTRSAP